VIRSLRPGAESVAARIDGVDHPLHHVADGLFSAVVPVPEPADYRLVVEYPGIGHRLS